MKVLTDHPTYERARKVPETGIRKTAKGWVAIQRDKLVGEFEGMGSKARAIQTAGTNKVIA